MSKILLFFTFIIVFFSSTIVKAEHFYDFQFTDTNKKTLNFKSLKGKTVLVVNIATRCGFTGQLDDIEKLYQIYKNKNFVVLGFPSNEFNEQSPESNTEIAQFCRLKYGVTFPLFEKQIVLGKDKNDLYKWLTTQKGFEGEISWNFVKFLIDKNGNVVGRFKSKIEPMDKEITKLIEQII